MQLQSRTTYNAKAILSTVDENRKRRILARDSLGNVTRRSRCLVVDDMTQLISCIAHLNAIVSERTFPGNRLTSPGDLAGVCAIKTAIVILRHADANFALSDAFFGEPSSSQHVNCLGEVSKLAVGDDSPKEEGIVL